LNDPTRLVSSFFARPIVIALVFSQTTHQSSPQSPFEPITNLTPSIIDSASSESPIVQTRQVHLQCGGKIVCTATSTVRITSPQVAHLFLQEKYAIGQMFRRLEKVPAFELRSVGLGPVKDDDDEKSSTSSSAHSGSSSNQLWRKYTLVIPHFECEILEVFPDRRMFILGEQWLTDPNSSPPVPEVLALTKKSDIDSTINQGLKLVVGGAILLMVSFEALRVFHW